ncbi:unnamed protein product [Brassica rapa]|uniref:Uncharacterized protein n=1 Tax=Brassica campestris TaxID=3711 RepID=A0A8D9M8L0_BRACM|nr:unnamed protein product [Brassica rapa]
MFLCVCFSVNRVIFNGVFFLEEGSFHGTCNCLFAVQGSSLHCYITTILLPSVGRDKNIYGCSSPLYRVAPLKREKRVMTAVIMVGRTEVKNFRFTQRGKILSRVNSHLVPTGKRRFQLIGQRFCVMATTNACDADTLLPPRKRLLAGFKKQNSNGSSSTSYSDGSSSSASTDVQTHLDNLLSSQLNDDNHGRSPEELAQASKATAALAAKIAKAARAAANEKAFIASKAVAAAKSALELFASFPAETAKERSPRKNKQKKHVPVHVLYSKGVADEDLARRLNRAIDNSPRVLTGHRNKKQKSVASTMYDGHDVAGVVDSDTSTDDEIDRTRVNKKVLLCDDNALKEKTGEGSGSSLGKRRGRVKLKKLALSKCASKDQENGIITKSPLAGSSNPLAQQEGSNGGVGQVRS